MESIKVCIAGITGWVGRVLGPAVVKSPDLALVSAVSRSQEGNDLGELFDLEDFSLTVSGNLEDALDADPDVLIDYTSPEAVKDHILEAIERGVHVVVGTSGLSDQDYEEIDSKAREKGVGVIAAGNFAMSAALMLHFATIAAKYLPSWEIIDYASSGKRDSPSGTANELAYRLSLVRPPEIPVRIEDTLGNKESRGANLNGNQVHSLRLPGYVIGADVVFGGDGERLTLKFDAGDKAETYVEGTLLAVRSVIGTVGLVRGLDKLLDI